MKLSTFQKMLKFFSSKEKFEKIKKESELWGFTCASCNKTTSIWEIGGIRANASGKPKMRIRCPKCYVGAAQNIVKREANVSLNNE